ncbi:Uncharacterised protein [Klebsiella pneumoniae]|uniref:Uncharacterized protein n=1 Tax=Klebsiella pneumoniae TaxID=573 RepID=A0A2X1SF02_KLEPN|nr:Uncharacterised protein [Klebsiella pneumoniae]STU72843.1 Uncharacterised protein [Klebsiella pneumoniae]
MASETNCIKSDKGNCKVPLIVLFGTSTNSINNTFCAPPNLFDRTISYNQRYS